MKYLILLLISVSGLLLQDAGAQQNEQIAGIPSVVHPVKTETTAEIMERGKNFPVRFIDKGEREYPGRKNLPQNPLALPIARYPATANDIYNPTPVANELAQTPSTSFNGVTGPGETGAFPPDDMGAVGPTQYILFVNGRIRSFNKTTGVADGVINVSPDAFFASVMTPLGGGVAINFTSDPRIRYDRLSARWLMVIIDVPGSTVSTPGDLNNRVMLAVSNSSTITGAPPGPFHSSSGRRVCSWIMKPLDLISMRRI